MIDTLIIRPEEPGDYLAIRQLLNDCFEQSAEADLVDAIRTSCPDAISFVACNDDDLLGFAMLSPARLERTSNHFEGFGLAPVAVHADYQKQGIGTSLIQTLLAIVPVNRAHFILVIGDPDYYQRFGFKPAIPLGIDCEWDVPDEAFMILPLSEQDDWAGIGRYREEFHQTV